MKKTICLLLTLLLSGLAVPAEVPRFGKGDRVVFIGDSITHGGTYHANIYLFYATRFPDAPFKVWNCGVSGDTAPGTNKRFASDIAVHEPTAATVMLGMNDAWAWLFDPAERDNPGREQGLRNAYELYTGEMKRLAASLQELGCRIIFIKPSIYDQTAELESKNLAGKNDMLRRYAAFLDELAAEYQAGVVDFQTPMLRVNEKLQKKNPAATVVGPDRVHPGPAGHFVMSFAFLKAQHMPAVVSSISIDAAGRKAVALENCSFTEEPEFREGGVAFSCLEKALPFPVAENQRPALEWVPFQQELNRQLFKVTGLKAGRYVLRIDGEPVGQWSAAALAEGINLSGIRTTPQYRQALNVKAANDARLGTVDKIRAIVHVRHTMIDKLDASVDVNDFQALETALNAYIEQSKGKPWYSYLRLQADKYLDYAPHEAALRADEERQMEKIWSLNRSRPHRWELLPVE